MQKFLFTITADTSKISENARGNIKFILVLVSETFNSSM